MDKIKVCSKQFMDEHGRERIFYGINMGGQESSSYEIVQRYIFH